MAAAESLRGQPPAGLAGSTESGLTLAPDPIDPSQSEEGLFYPVLSEPVPTRLVEGIGKVAGTRQEVEFTLEGPADEAMVTDSVPLLIFHGLCGVESAYDNFRSQIAQRGKWAATWKPIRNRGLAADLNLLNVRHPQKLASQAALGVARAVQAETGAEAFDAWAHSNGGQSATELAIHKSELIRTIALASVVGLDKHNLVQMIGRLGDFTLNDLMPSLGRLTSNPSFVKEEVEYIGRNPALTLAEALSAGICSLHERIIRVRRLGIPVGAIQYARDDFHPERAVADHSEHLFDAYHVYRDPSAKHTSPQEDPGGNAEAYFKVSRELQKRPALAVVG